MNNEMRTKDLTLAGILTGLSVVIALSMFAFPLLQLLMPLVSIPIIIIGVKLNLKLQLLSVLALTSLLMIMDPIYAVQITLSASALAVIQGYLLKQKSAISKVIFYGACGHFLGQLGYFYIINFALDINVIEELKVMINMTFEEVMVVMKTTTNFSETEINDGLLSFAQTKDRMLLLIPSMLVIVSFISSTVTYLFAHLIFSRIQLPISKGKFENFRIGMTGKLIMTTTFVVVTLVGLLDPVNNEIYISNYLTIIMMILQVNGLALLWYTSKNKANKSFLRISTLLLFIFSPIAGGFIELIVKLGFAFLGLVDIFYDFRKKYEEKN